MNHLLRSLAPISDSSGACSTRRRASVWRRRSPRASSSTSPDRTAGPTRRPTSAARAHSVGAVQRRQRAPAARASARRGPGRLRRLARGAPRQRPGRRRRRSRRSTRPRTRWRWPRTWPCSMAGRVRSPGSRRPRRTTRCRSATCPTDTRGRWRPVERLLHNGISGPYALALGGEQYQRVVETAEHGGYPLLEHLRKILEGPIVWAPGVKGAIVISLRGGDFLFESGQDLSIGYTSHNARTSGCISRRASASTSRRRRRRSCSRRSAGQRPSAPYSVAKSTSEALMMTVTADPSGRPKPPHGLDRDRGTRAADR